MKKLILFVLVLLLVSPVFAQTLIAVQNGSTPKFYSILQDALTAAQNKDTLYIPGGSYSLTNRLITIDKELHLIGAGHYQDSTIVGITQLNATIQLETGANNSSFEGFYLNGSFSCGTSSTDEDVDNINIARCKFGSISLSKSSTNWIIRENVITGVISGTSQGFSSSGSWAMNNLFSNNLCFNRILGFGPNNKFENNLFYWSSSTGTSDYIDGCIFRNNIFPYTFFSYEDISGVSSCIFENNIFYSSCCPIGIGNSCNNNLYSQNSANTFVNQSGTTFDYKQDYHLKSDSPGKNAGKDGTDIGIYGGTFPWKEGSVPSNPHFKSVKISPKTDNLGNLNVRINVAAQDN
jgi:hypothetical protein